MPWYLTFVVVASAVATTHYVRSTQGVGRRGAWLALLVSVGWVAGGLLQGAPLFAAIADPGQDRSITGIYVGLLLVSCAVIAGRASQQMLDAACQAFLLGDAIARIGCLLSGCDHGAPMPGGWEWLGIRYGPDTAAYLAYPPSGDDAGASLACWPSPALEGLGCLILFVLARSSRHTLSVVFVGWPLLRLAVELTRGDHRELVFGYPTTLVAAIGALVAGLAISWHVSARRTARSDVDPGLGPMSGGPERAAPDEAVAPSPVAPPG